MTKRNIHSDEFRVVACTAVVGLLTIGPHFVVSEYRHPLLSLHPEWGSTFLQHTVAVGAIGYVLSGFIGGDVKNRGYPFYTVFGCVCAALSHAAAALGVRYNDLWLFMLGQGFFDTLGGGCLMTVTMSHATAWLDPAVAASLVGGIVGVSATGLSYAMGAVMQFVSAEACLWGLTGLALIACVAAPFFRPAPPPPSPCTSSPPVAAVPSSPTSSSLTVQSPLLHAQMNNTGNKALDAPLSRGELLCLIPFYFVWGQVAFGLTPGFALISAYSSIFADTLRCSFFMSAVFTGVANALYCAGRICGGVMCRRWGVKRWGCILVLCGCCGCVLVPLGSWVGQSWLVVVGTSMVAFQLGGNQVYAGPLIVHVLGRDNIATAYGLILTGVAFASVIGPAALLAQLVDVGCSQGNSDAGSASCRYNAFFLTCFGVLLLSLLCVVVTHDTPMHALLTVSRRRRRTLASAHSANMSLQSRDETTTTVSPPSPDDEDDDSDPPPTEMRLSEATLCKSEKAMRE